jgi:hypothetical protein
MKEPKVKIYAVGSSEVDYFVDEEEALNKKQTYENKHPSNSAEIVEIEFSISNIVDS